MGVPVSRQRNPPGIYERQDSNSVHGVNSITNATSVTIAIRDIKKQAARSTIIDKSLLKEKNDDLSRVKILLLGGADAGKSTILKQMSGFSDEEMHSFHKHLRFNVFQIFHEVAIGVQECITSIAENEKHLIYRFAEGLSWYMGLDDEKENDILLSFLEMKCVLSFMEQFPNYSSLPDNAHYYFPKLATLLSPEYMPTSEDILHLRIPTTAVNEINFSFATSTIRLIDVGGQRTYRKKWIHCFDGVAAVLFVASMAAYDQARPLFTIQALDEVDVMIKPVLHKDLLSPAHADKPLKLPNRLRDSAQLFGEMLRSTFLLASAFILFLNKKDLFAKKLPVHPLNKYISGYTGRNTEQASEYLKEYFLKRKSKKDKDRKIYSHYTCATDTKNVEFVFKAACDIVLTKNLNSSGIQ